LGKKTIDRFGRMILPRIAQNGQNVFAGGVLERGERKMMRLMGG